MAHTFESRACKTATSRLSIGVTQPEFGIYGNRYEILPEETCERMSRRLGKDVRDFVKSSGIKVGGVVMPLRGGYTPSVCVADALSDLYDQEVPLYPFGVSHYYDNFTGGEARGVKTKIYHHIQGPLNPELKYIIADDVNQTSRTRDETVAELAGLGVPEGNVLYAVIYQKPQYYESSANFYQKETGLWVVFPLEDTSGCSFISVPNGPQIVYEPWEFWTNQFPKWMVPKEGEQRLGDSLGKALGRAKKIGFLPDELPDLENQNFMDGLLQALLHQLKEEAHLGDEEATYQAEVLLKS